MDDPWDVKSVRGPGQYISCMKINGSPLLPPVLSKKCHNEMQYYKMLAKEVEKRISILQPHVKNDNTGSRADSEENRPEEAAQTAFNMTLSNLKTLNKQSLESELPTSDFFEMSSPNVGTTADTSSNFVIDFSLSINQSGRNVLETVKRLPPAIEFRERGHTPLKEKQLLTDVQTTGNQRDKIKTKILEDTEGYRNDIINDFPVVESIEGQGDLLQSKLLQNTYKTALRHNYAPVKTICSHKDKEKNKQLEYISRHKIDNKKLSHNKEDSSFSLLADVSFSSKSFTGSLNNLHTESLKDCDIPNFTRQRSYTVLNPSPQLLAHLEVQSITTGVEVESISMSESLSSLVAQKSKKRRSWDLESAKVKWSSMAQDLNKNLPGCNVRNSTKPASKTTTQASYSPPPKAKTVILDKNKRATTAKCGVKSEGISKGKPSPQRDYSSNTTVMLGPTSAKSPTQKRQPPPRSPPTPKSPKSPPATLAREGDNPAKMVRELYEKIQRDQMVQMASLVEKQKKEQKRLQQVFEEQNNILFKQLKTIVPEGSIEAKQAWGIDSMEPERGPVSLSQLIDHNKTDHQIILTDTHNYISKCDTVLKKSRDIASTINKPKSVTPNGFKSQSLKVPDRSKSKCRSPVRNTLTPTKKALTHSPTRSSAGRHLIKSPQCLLPAQRSRSRKLNYDTSSDREPDVILTDRTNDTLADLNVTFPTDKSDTETCRSASPPLNENVLTFLRSVSVAPKATSKSPKHSANNGVEETSKHFMSGNVCQHSSAGSPQAPPSPPPKQLVAASKIVAFAKGYLVRRLMRTERVTATVQTIRDALLCALQLHQDREGIRGADVDLHRRLIQQITAACYSLHDTFIASTPAERCALIAADRARLLRPRPISAQSLATRCTDVMSQSHSGVFPPRPRRASTSASLMTQSTYETYSSDKGRRPRYAPSPRRRPWR